MLEYTGPAALTARHAQGRRLRVRLPRPGRDVRRGVRGARRCSRVSSLLASKPSRAITARWQPKNPPLPAKAKRVIFLFMQGGPSHVDTVRLQAQAGDRRRQGRARRKAAAVALQVLTASGKSGLWISELFPNVARHADELCILNGMHGDNPAHPQATIALHTGTATFVRPSVGAWVLYGLGTQNQNLPGFITINPPAGLGGAQNYGSAFLPATFQGTRVDGGGIADIASHVAKPMQRRQLDLVQQMNRDFAGRSRAQRADSTG